MYFFVVFIMPLTVIWMAASSYLRGMQEEAEWNEFLQRPFTYTLGEIPASQGGLSLGSVTGQPVWIELSGEGSPVIVQTPSPTAPTSLPTSTPLSTPTTPVPAGSSGIIVERFVGPSQFPAILFSNISSSNILSSVSSLSNVSPSSLPSLPIGDQLLFSLPPLSNFAGILVPSMPEFGSLIEIAAFPWSLASLPLLFGGNTLPTIAGAGAVGSAAITPVAGGSTITIIPEPHTLLSLAAGVGLLAKFRKRRKQATA